MVPRGPLGSIQGATGDHSGGDWGAFRGPLGTIQRATDYSGGHWGLFRGPLGTIQGVTGNHSGGHWGPFRGSLGTIQGCLGAPLGSLWLPLGGLGAPCGCFPEILETGDLVSHEVTRIAIRSAFLEHAAGNHGSHGSHGSGVKNSARSPPPTRAGGQDDGSYTHSLKLYGNLGFSVPKPGKKYKITYSVIFVNVCPTYIFLREFV